MLGDVEETIFIAEEEDDEKEPSVRTVKKQSEMLFVRGMRGLWCFREEPELTKWQATRWSSSHRQKELHNDDSASILAETARSDPQIAYDNYRRNTTIAKKQSQTRCPRADIAGRIGLEEK